MPPLPPDLPWTALSGAWKGIDYEIYGSPAWRMLLDLKFRENGDLTGEGTFVSLMRPTKLRGKIRGFGSLAPDGTRRVTWAVVYNGFMFFPSLELSESGGRLRLQGQGGLAEVGDDFDTRPVVAAARALGPGEEIEQTEVGLELLWCDQGTYRLRKQSAADQERERLRSQARDALRALTPAGSKATRTCVFLRRAGDDWQATGKLGHEPGGGEEASLVFTAGGHGSTQALRNLIAALEQKRAGR